MKAGIFKRHSTILDQIIVSGGNFFITIILARQLDEELFGVYSLIWLMVISVAAILQALFIAPLLSICPKLNEMESERFVTLILAELLLMLLLMCSILFIVTLVSAHFEYDAFSVSVTYYLMLAAPYFLYDYIRRRLMVQDKNISLLWLDIFSYLMIIIGLMFLLDGEIFNAVIVISIVFTISSIFMLARFGLKLEVLKKSPRKCAYLLKKQWKFTKWLLGSAFLQFINGNALTIISGAIISISQVGYIRMAQNIVGMINPIYLFLDNHAQLYLARISYKEGVKSCEQMYRKLAVACMLVLFLMLAAIYVFSEQLISILYGKQDDIISDYLILMLVVSFVTGANFLERLLAKVQENTKVIFRSYFYSSIVACIVIYPLSDRFGGAGVIYAIITAQLVMLAVVLASRHWRKTKNCF